MRGKVHQHQDRFVVFCQPVKESSYCMCVSVCGRGYVCVHFVCMNPNYLHVLFGVCCAYGCLCRTLSCWHAYAAFLFLLVCLVGNRSRRRPATVSVCGACPGVQEAYTSRLCLSRRLTYVCGRRPSTAGRSHERAALFLPFFPRLVGGKEKMSGASASSSMKKCR